MSRPPSWRFVILRARGGVLRSPRSKKDRPMKLLTGDFDVFGDGSATLLSTPGHTPGHQSFLVHIDKTGWLLMTGDAAHFKDNWDNDRVPSMREPGLGGGIKCLRGFPSSRQLHECQREFSPL
jgi:glyoxylase-like metal-dependent hydrolase (beta-lactamase superfamily II)